MNNFTITHVGDIKLTLPMPFIFIEAKGKTFEFQKGELEGSKMITFEEDYWLCAYQTTQELWEAVVKTSQNKDLNPNPSYFKGKHRPVEKVTWDDIQIFNGEINKIIESENIKCNAMLTSIGTAGLPTEIEWEYAALADSNFVFCGSQNLDDVAWYVKNSNAQTMPVGQKQPNKFGLYDMCGNVWEWCENNYIRIITKEHKITKALRGGGYHDKIQFSRTLDCTFDIPDKKYQNVGFRIQISINSFVK
jgi:formylglycine-generating enzyme